ncbi:type IV secretion system protein [Acidihalobacter ferrooxydans]|uniref:type IV secretion system protein n=1 Tax=Acidihalobacter ferrooxydans TaxID=1765967 RepID=UPI0018DE65E3|nr:type IV secretion system protein [Acidihalobacter ferrooxydans]
MQRDRFFIAMMGALAVALVEAGALVALIPLHKVEPYVIKVNTNGAIVSSGVAQSSVRPSTAQITYWVGQFAKNLYTIEPGQTRANVAQAYYLTQGAAVGQFSRFMEKHNPVRLLQANPALRVTVKIQGVSEIARNTVYVTGQVVNHLTGRRAALGMTVSYALAPPKTVSAAMNNPLGIHITNFVIQEG